MSRHPCGHERQEWPPGRTLPCAACSKAKTIQAGGEMLTRERLPTGWAWCSVIDMEGRP